MRLGIMETTTTNDKLCQSFEAVFNNYVICRKICTYLPISDLPRMASLSTLFQYCPNVNIICSWISYNQMVIFCRSVATKEKAERPKKAVADFFFWEYFHRLWGRLIGLVFFIPFVDIQQIILQFCDTIPSFP